jgi:nucleoside-diphosphate-sugar epimerase
VKKNKKQIFCFGFGFSAQGLARNLSSLEWKIGGTCREEAKQIELFQRGWEGFIFDGNGSNSKLPEFFRESSHLLISIPPKPTDFVLDNFILDILKKKDWQWIGYLSTTGVYGDKGGEVVTEASELNPTINRAKKRLDAENGWLKLFAEHDLPVHIFRCVGIYGPGRNPLETVRKGLGKRIDKAGYKFSRVHVDDLASVLIASINKPNPGSIYNVCDDQPIESRHVTEYACELLKTDLPPLIPFDDANLSEMAKSFYLDRKTISNQKIKDELGVKLKYPNYKVGLECLLENQSL